MWHACRHDCHTFVVFHLFYPIAALSTCLLEEAGGAPTGGGAPTQFMVKGTCSGKSLMELIASPAGRSFGFARCLGRDDNPRRPPLPSLHIFRRHPCGPEANMFT